MGEGVLSVVHVGLDDIAVHVDFQIIALADLGRLGDESALPIVRAHGAAVGAKAPARSRNAIAADVENLAVMQFKRHAEAPLPASEDVAIGRA